MLAIPSIIFCRPSFCSYVGVIKFQSVNLYFVDIQMTNHYAIPNSINTGKDVKRQYKSNRICKLTRNSYILPYKLFHWMRSKTSQFKLNGTEQISTQDKSIQAELTRWTFKGLLFRAIMRCLVSIWCFCLLKFWSRSNIMMKSLPKSQ